MRIRSSCVIAAAVLSLLGAVPSSAAPIVYTNQAAFLAAVSNIGVDTFDDLGVGNLWVKRLENRSAGPHTYDVSIDFHADDGYLWGLAEPAPDDDKRWLSNNQAGGIIVFDNFSPGVQGLGAFFFATDNPGNVIPWSFIVTATDASGTATSVTLPTPEPTFLGFVSDGALTSVTVTSVGSGWYPTVNDLHLASAAVPEPVSVALLAPGLLAAGVWRRRKRDV